MTGEFDELSAYSAALIVGCVGVVSQSGSVSTCSFASPRFSVFAVGLEEPSYQWQFEFIPGFWADIPDGNVLGIGLVEGATTNELKVLLPAPGADVNLRCVVTVPSCGSTTSEPVQLSVCDYAADTNCDGQVDLVDVATLITHYGMTSGATREHGDNDGDGDTDLSDVALLVTAYGSVCP
jgi:hypothetical protein